MRRNQNQPRIDQILRMRKEGASVDEIAEALGLWPDRVHTIARKFEPEGVVAARSRRFLERVRKANDPDKKWIAKHLIQALQLKTMTETALIRHYTWNQVEEISLRELMDAAVSDQEHPKPGYRITPLLAFRCVGVEGFWSLVRNLTQSDLGEKCNAAWQENGAPVQTVTNSNFPAYSNLLSR
jgi:transposase